MKPGRRAAPFLCFAVLFAVAGLAGCAGASLQKISEAALPGELPQEFAEKFTVKEVAPLPAPSPSPSPEPKGSRKRKPKKPVVAAVVKATTEAAPAAIVYPVRRPAKDPIWVGEKATYQIQYFGMAAGEFTAEAMPHKVINNREVYHVKGTAVSSKVFSLFYRLNDIIETFFDYEGFFTHRFHLILDESKQTRDSLELNDSEKAQTYWWNRWHPKDSDYQEKKEFQPMTPFSQDSLSALYYLRSVPLPTGGEVSFPVVSEGKTWEAVVSVIRRELVDSPMGRIQAVVVKPETKYQGVLQKRGDSFIWLSDDDRRYPLRMEAKVKIGTVTAELKSLEPGTPPAP